MSNLRWPGSSSRGRSRYFWITCTWPWRSMKSNSSVASEEMRIPSPTGNQTRNGSWSRSSPGSALHSSGRPATLLFPSSPPPASHFLLHPWKHRGHQPFFSIWSCKCCLCRLQPQNFIYRHSECPGTLSRRHPPIGHWLPPWRALPAITSNTVS